MRTKHTLLLSLLLIGCSSSDDPKNNGDCKVSCPAGTRCEKDRCVPVCVPPCAADEHCGSDNLCHKGAAPDGGTVPPVDSGAPKQDQGSPKSDTTPTMPDAKPAKPDAGDPNKKLCDCLAKQPKHGYCSKPKPCQVSTDCCLKSTVPCGVYGNKYLCSAGECRPDACGSDSECVTYAQAIKQPDASDYACHPAACPGGRDYCGAKVKSCSKTSDCCKTGKTACGIYTNHWTCSSGTCKYLGCTSNNECVAWALSMGVSNASGYVCRTTACYATGQCKLKPKSCNKPTDCCDPKSSIPCGVYTNRYRCENNECVLDGCTTKSDCQTWAITVKLLDANLYECIFP